MDLKDSIQLVCDTAVEAHGERLLIDHRDKRTYLINGAVVEVKKTPPPRQLTAGSLGTIYALVVEDLSTVWHSSNAVVLVINDELASDRLDRCELSLTTSEKWNAATSAAKQARPQKDFIRFLKQNLRDEVNAALPGFLTSLEKVVFKKDTAGEGTVTQGRESMGRLIKSEVSGTADFPETILLSVRRWGELEFVGHIEFSLIIDTDNATFALVPLADTVKLAENAAHEWLGELIEENVKCPVYFGKP